MVSRAAAGIVFAAGLDWSVARNRQDYADLAVQMVGKRKALSWAKRKVHEARMVSSKNEDPARKSVLFDLKVWVLYWERALMMAYHAQTHFRPGQPSSSKSTRSEPFSLGYHVSVAK